MNQNVCDTDDGMAINSIINKLSLNKKPLSINCKNKLISQLKSQLSNSTANIHEQANSAKSSKIEYFILDFSSKQSSVQPRFPKIFEATGWISNQNSPLTKPVDIPNTKKQKEAHTAHVDLASKQPVNRPRPSTPAQFVYQSNFMNYPKSFTPPQSTPQMPPGMHNAFFPSQSHYWSQINQNPYLDPVTNTYYNPYISFNNGYALFDHSATAPPNFYSSTPNPYDNKNFQF
jgi:hypothetical protein